MNKNHMSGRALVLFAMAAAFASAVPASAATILVLDRSLPPEVKITGTNYEVDEHLGQRAQTGWVVEFAAAEPTRSARLGR